MCADGRRETGPHMCVIDWRRGVGRWPPRLLAVMGIYAALVRSHGLFKHCPPSPRPSALPSFAVPRGRRRGQDFAPWRGGVSVHYSGSYPMVFQHSGDPPLRCSRTPDHRPTAPARGSASPAHRRGGPPRPACRRLAVRRLVHVWGKQSSASRHRVSILCAELGELIPDPGAFLRESGTGTLQ